MPHAQGPFGKQPFGHRPHVKFAWTVLGEHEVDAAERIVTNEISAFAEIKAPGPCRP